MRPTLALLTSFVLSALAAVTPAVAGPSPAVSALCPFQREALAAQLAPELAEHEGRALILDTLAGYEKRYGRCRKALSDGPNRFRFEFRLASLGAELRFDRKGRLADFAFGPAEFRHDSLAELEATLRRFGGSASFYSERNGRPLLAFRENEPLNISRSFLLFVLRALNESIAAGAHGPKDSVQLQGDSLSVSFGLLHHWAPGTWLTLDTLKNLAAVEGDATAVDLLLESLGRARVEKTGRFLAPLLSSREAARLRGGLPAGARIASRAEAVARLASLPAPGGPVEFPADRFDLTPVVGWFASTKELCATALSLRTEPALQHAFRDLREQPGRPGAKPDLLVETRDPGIAQSTLVFREAGSTFCLALTLNQGSPLDERDPRDLLARAESLLLKGEAERGDKEKAGNGHPNP